MKELSIFNCLLNFSNKESTLTLANTYDLPKTLANSLANLLILLLDMSNFRHF